MNIKKIPNSIWLTVQNVDSTRIECPEGHVLHQGWQPERRMYYYFTCSECGIRYGTGQLKLTPTRMPKQRRITFTAGQASLVPPGFIAYTTAFNNSTTWRAR